MPLPLNQSELLASFPDNNAKQITPSNIRDFVQSVALLSGEQAVTGTLTATDVTTTAGSFNALAGTVAANTTSINTLNSNKANASTVQTIMAQQPAQGPITFTPATTGWYRIAAEATVGSQSGDVRITGSYTTSISGQTVTKADDTLFAYSAESALYWYNRGGTGIVTLKRSNNGANLINQIRTGCDGPSPSTSPNTYLDVYVTHTGVPITITAYGSRAVLNATVTAATTPSNVTATLSLAGYLNSQQIQAIATTGTFFGNGAGLTAIPTPTFQTVLQAGNIANGVPVYIGNGNGAGGGKLGLDAGPIDFGGASPGTPLDGATIQAYMPVQWYGSQYYLPLYQ